MPSNPHLLHIINIIVKDGAVQDVQIPEPLKDVAAVEVKDYDVDSINNKTILTDSEGEEYVSDLYRL